MTKSAPETDSRGHTGLATTLTSVMMNLKRVRIGSELVQNGENRKVQLIIKPWL